MSAVSVRQGETVSDWYCNCFTNHFHLLNNNLISGEHVKVRKHSFAGSGGHLPSNKLGWWTQMGVMLVKQVKNTICPFSCHIFVVRMTNIHLMLQLSSLAHHSAIEWFFHQFRARRTWFIQMEELYSSYDCRWLYSNNNKCPVQVIFSFIIYNHTLSICRVSSYPVFSAWSCGIFLLSLTTSSSYRDTKHGMNTVF